MSEELYKLTAESLCRLDRGALSVALEQSVSQAARDCLDRPTDDRARKVTLTIELIPKPVFDDDTRSIEVDGVAGKYKIKCSVPDRESACLDFGIQSDGTLIFNENVPDNHRQRSLLTDEEDEDAERSD